MRKFFLIVIFITIAIILGCAKRPEAQPPIKIAINSWAGYAHAYIAKEKGYFEKNGARVELVFDKNYTPCRQRYIDGRMDGFLESTPTIFC